MVIPSALVIQKEKLEDFRLQVTKVVITEHFDTFVANTVTYQELCLTKKALAK